MRVRRRKGIPARRSGDRAKREGKGEANSVSSPAAGDLPFRMRWHNRAGAKEEREGRGRDGGGPSSFA